MSNLCLLSVDVNGISVSEKVPGKLLEKGTGRGCRASAGRSNRVSGTLDLQLQKSLRWRKKGGSILGKKIHDNIIDAI